MFSAKCCLTLFPMAAASWVGYRITKQVPIVPMIIPTKINSTKKLPKVFPDYQDASAKSMQGRSCTSPQGNRKGLPLQSLASMLI